MTYQEMQAAEAEYLRALAPESKKQRGATKAQLQRRAQMLRLCVNCGSPPPPTDEGGPGHRERRARGWRTERRALSPARPPDPRERNGS